MCFICTKEDGYGNLLVAPNLISPHVRRVQILLSLIEHHSMYSRSLIKLSILNVVFQLPTFIDTKDIQESRMVVERIAVNAIRSLLRRQHKDSPRFRVYVVGARMASNRQRCMVCDLCWALDCVRAPLLHTSAIDVLSRVLLPNSSVMCPVLRVMGPTSKAIHEIGWSSGISVLFTSSSACVSSSKATVKMAPGGVLQTLH